MTIAKFLFTAQCNRLNKARLLALLATNKVHYTRRSNRHTKITTNCQSCL